MQETGGYVYVLTNPSFPEYVKIGYADDVDKRVAQLNRSECTPFAFRKHATLHVLVRLADKNIHNLIDKLKPELRAKENVNGKLRIREFFAMTADEAVELLEAIGGMFGETPEIFENSVNAQKENKIASDITIAREKRSPFSFYKCGIKNGSKIVYTGDPSIVCFVAGDREISYNGKNTSLTALAKRLLHKSYGVQGTLFFSYEGEVLSALRKRLENEGLYKDSDEILTPSTNTKITTNNTEYDDILYFTMSKYNARCRRISAGYVLLKGSKIAPTLSSSCRDGKKLRDKYAAMISPDFTTLEEICFSSSSSAAKFVAGTSLNGKLYWKTKEGVLLKDLLTKNDL